MNFRKSLIFFICFNLSINHLYGKEVKMEIEIIFENALMSKEIKFKKIEKYLYKIIINNETKTISLENINKNYIRYLDKAIVYRFIDNVLKEIEALPEWQVLKKGIFVAIESLENIDITNLLYKNISKTTVVTLAYYSASQNQVRYLLKSELMERGLNDDLAWSQAYKNLEELIIDAKIEYLDIDGEKLGMIEVNEPHKVNKGFKIEGF